jgi:hypothetical protein
MSPQSPFPRPKKKRPTRRQRRRNHKKILLDKLENGTITKKEREKLEGHASKRSGSKGGDQIDRRPERKTKKRKPNAAGPSTTNVPTRPQEPGQPPPRPQIGKTVVRRLSQLLTRPGAKFQ